AARAGGGGRGGGAQGAGGRAYPGSPSAARTVSGEQRERFAPWTPGGRGAGAEPYHGGRTGAANGVEGGNESAAGPGGPRGPAAPRRATPRDRPMRGSEASRGRACRR